MSTIVVRYRPRPDQADHNQELIEQVFAQLTDEQPDGLRYACFRLDDGTFVHIADVEADPNPLGGIAAFAAFQEGIMDRCGPDDGPNPQPATLVGSYRFLAAD